MNLPRPAGFIALALGLIMSLITVDGAQADKKSHVSTFKLDNGLEVVVIPDHRAPVVTHMVWYRVGAADEPPGRSGIAHFLEHLMFKGTEKVPPAEFSKIIARNGGEDNAFTSQDATAYHQRVAKDRLELVMELEADRMANLKLLEQDVLTERKVILEERRSRVENDPASILNEQMMAALYLSHPYGIPVIGWEHEMKNLSQKDAMEFYQRYYAPNNAVLVVSGDVTPDQVRKLAEKTYGKLEPSKAVGERIRPQEPEHDAARRIVLKDPRAGKTTVSREYLAPSYRTAKPGEAESLDLMMKVLAGGVTSRLYKKLVVNEKVASSAEGWYSGSGRDSGRLSFYAVAAGNETADTLEKMIDEVIAEFLSGNVSEKELNRARNDYLADYIYGSDSQSSLARRYGWGLVSGRTIEDIESWPDRLQAVTTDDVEKVARKYLQDKRSVTGFLLPIPKEAVEKNSPARPKS